MDWIGQVRQSRCVWARTGKVGMLRRGRRGMARPDKDRRGEAGAARLGMARLGMARIGTAGVEKRQKEVIK